MRRFVALTAIVLLSAEFASAGPMVPKDISADAKWFGHANLDALHSMTLVKNLKEKSPIFKQYQAKANELAKKLGISSMEDVLGATLYSNRYESQVGVALVYVKYSDPEKMVGLLKEQYPDHKTSEHGSRTLYHWTVNLYGVNLDMTGTLASDKLIVIGSDAEQVKVALDVLDGKKPGIAKDAPLIKGMPKDALFAARCIDVPEAYRKTSSCPVLSNCKSASTVWIEKNGLISGKYEFLAVSKEMASNLKNNVEGIKTLGNFGYGNIPAVRNVLDGIKYKGSGKMVLVTFNASSANVEAAVKAVTGQ